IGFGIFLVAFTRTLVRTRPFAFLRNPQPTSELQGTDRAGLLWFWGGLGVSAVFSGLSYVWLSQRVADFVPGWVPQSPPYFIGLWAAINGVFALIVLALFYFLSAKKKGFSLRDSGALPGWRAVG